MVKSPGNKRHIRIVATQYVTSATYKQVVKHVCWLVAMATLRQDPQVPSDAILCPLHHFVHVEVELLTHFDLHL